MKRIITLFILISFAVSPLLADRKADLKGKVISKNAEGKTTAVPFATIYWEGTDVFTDTDDDGNFTLPRRSGKEHLLIATALGYVRDTLEVSLEKTYQEVILKEENVLDEAVVVAGNEGNYLSKLMTVKTEVISAAGLCKMACCNLAESFENSASVSVGYSDAVTGARQIRLLGLSGIYTAMLDENRPVMRGLASPFGLSYIPGQWLESIQIAKGPSSVINGIESITGQINMEHRKPTDEKPLFINVLLNSMLKADLNVASSLQLNNKWSTVILGHVSGDPMRHDMDKDGFRDEPNSFQVNIANRWLYYSETGLQVRFGVKALYEDRVGGQMDFRKSQIDSLSTGLVPWGTNIVNKGANAWFKVGVPFDEDQNHSLALVGDYAFHEFDSYFGLKSYFGKQNSGFLNVIYQGVFNDDHRLSVGVRDFYDDFNDVLHDGPFGSTDLSRAENSIGVYGEYTYSFGEKFTAVAGLSYDYNNLYGSHLSPRVNLKWAPWDFLTIRAQGGRGMRSPNVVVDNLGMMSTSRKISLPDHLDMETAWTYGGNITAYFPAGFNDNCYLSFDYFRSDFTRQLIVDQEYDTDLISIYNLEGPSFTNTYQADFSIEPLERFTILATFRYTDSKVTLKGQGLVDRPLVSRYKGVLNLQYATPMNKWIFDFTAQVNGPSRIPDFALAPGESNMSPVYPILFLQVTKKFKGIDVYVGAENLTNYRQKNPIISADDPYAPDFNASVIWGPLMGIRVHAGLRFTLWK